LFLESHEGEEVEQVTPGKDGNRQKWNCDDKCLASDFG
jgi:hypothetical protein